MSSQMDYEPPTARSHRTREPWYIRAAYELGSIALIVVALACVWLAAMLIGGGL